MRVASCVLLFSLSACTPRRVELPLRPTNNTAFNRLLFCGDVMFSRGVRRQILASGDPALPFRKVANVLAAADITFINLESPFSDKGPYHDDGLVFHAAPQMIAGLELAHVAIASTANNHARDCGSHGVDYTIAWLRAHDVAAVGSSPTRDETHRGVVLVRHGVRFGFLGYTFDQQNGNWRDIDDRIALADSAVMRHDVAELRKQTDVVIVSMHSGIEYMPRPSRAQIAFAHAAIDAGATVVIGHHPHVKQPTETYGRGVIFYSLGNFVFDQFQREATQHGEMAEVDFVGKTLVSSVAWPVKITLTGPQWEQ